MAFNIEWGGKHVSFDKVVEAIRTSGADIVAIQEAEGNLAELAAALNWYVDERSYVVSRFRLLSPAGSGGRYTLAEVEPNRFVAVASVHLPSEEYGPDLVRDGAELQEVLDTERRVRLPMLQTHLGAMKSNLPVEMPRFLLGDFNAPAHTDWTKDTAQVRDSVLFPVPWPTSLAMEAAGFRDAWRTIHPDAVRHPGLTWWAARPAIPGYSPGPRDPSDRIDLIWYSGPATPVAATLTGEPGAQDVSVEIAPWPSDHRAVVADFELEAAAGPKFVTTDRHVYSTESRISIVGVFDAGREVSITLENAHGEQFDLASPQRGGSFEIQIDAPPPGRYRLAAITESETFRAEFWVQDAEAAPTLSIQDSEIAEGDPIVVAWRYAPGFRNDYLALYEEGASDLVADQLAYEYVHAKPEGTLEFAMRPAPGRYYLALMKDDGYEALAKSAVFTVLSDDEG